VGLGLEKAQKNIILVAEQQEIDFAGPLTSKDLATAATHEITFYPFGQTKTSSTINSYFRYFGACLSSKTYGEVEV
jgi:hypothetical protein